MNTYITISSLNDYLFCPYSLYLHNIYAETDDGIYHAKPQTQGKLAHISVDNKTASWKITANISCLPIEGLKLTEVLPDGMKLLSVDKIEIRESEPYSYCQFIAGKDHSARRNRIDPVFHFKGNIPAEV